MSARWSISGPMEHHDWFVGDMTGFYKDVNLFTPDGLPDWEKLSIPLYLGRSQYLIASKAATILNLYRNNI